MKRTASHDLAPLHGRHLRLTRVDETRVQRRWLRPLAERGRTAGPTVKSREDKRRKNNLSETNFIEKRSKNRLYPTPKIVVHGNAKYPLFSVL